MPETTDTFSKAVEQRKPAPSPNDLFDTPSEDFNVKKVRARIKQSEEEQAKARKKALNHKFTQGKKYFIHDSSVTNSWEHESYIFIYQGKQGKHHIFRHAQGKWSRTYTDAQLIGKFIKKVE